MAETRRMMATDRYIRIVLTVIAACLVYLCVRDGAPPALAQSPPQPVEVVLVGVNRDARNLPWQPLAITPQSQPQDVVIVGVERRQSWTPLAVTGADGGRLNVNVMNEVRTQVANEVRTYVTNK
jgi:hypothetical protein